ncbi:MAG: hypothetical protein ACTSR3_22115, partial [Candidatus Helarchaeota archaeon]
IAIQNETNTFISKINAIINPSSQYRIDNQIQKIDVLTPGETRGVDFILVPLTCGRSKVFGTVSYIDAFGNHYSQSIEPKEIWIKCPLVTPQKATTSDIENWKKKFLKGSTLIKYSNIEDLQAFKIICEQVSSLDLTEIIKDNNKLFAVYSGRAKVSNNTIIIEVQGVDSQIKLEVWTAEIQQATGIIAHLKNLINVALTVAEKLHLKIEKIGQTILDCFSINERLNKCYQFCEEYEKNHEILLLLKELTTKLRRNLPEIPVLKDLKLLQGEIEKYLPEDNISGKLVVELEYNLLQSMKELLKIIQSNSVLYYETFKDQISTFNKIQAQIDKLIADINKFEKKYAKNILKYLLVIKQDSGVALFNQNFGEMELDSDLVSGFLTAIQSFGSEVSKETTTIKKLTYKDFEIVLEDGHIIRAALVLIGPNIKFLYSKLQNFIAEFESAYEDTLRNWTGNVSIFKDLQLKLNELFFK